MKKTTMVIRVVLAATMVTLLGGCPPRPWRPPPPRGKTWAYDGRGTHATHTAFATGRAGPVRYGMFFASSGHKDAPSIKHPDRFWKRQSARSYRFNAHLGQRGDAVAPGPDRPRVGGASPPGPQEPAPAPSEAHSDQDSQPEDGR